MSRINGVVPHIKTGRAIPNAKPNIYSPDLSPTAASRAKKGLEPVPAKPGSFAALAAELRGRANTTTQPINATPAPQATQSAIDAAKPTSHAPMAIEGVKPNPMLPMAVEATKPIVRSPSAISGAQPIPPTPSATDVAKPNTRLPLAKREPKPRQPALSAGTAAKPGTVAPEASTDPSAEMCAQIVQHQKFRKFAIGMQGVMNRKMEALIASSFGYHIEQTEADRKALFKKAKSIRVAVEGEKEIADRMIAAFPEAKPLISIIRANAAGREQWDVLRERHENAMTRLAKQLPVWPKMQHVRGFGALGLAILVGEAGRPIGDYKSVAAIWKRLGLAVIDGERQQKKTNATLAEMHGYNPRRRAEVWTLADSMFRAQRAGEKDGVPAHSLGPYGDAYERRRALTEPRIEATAHLDYTHPQKWTKARCFADARRVMFKLFLMHLYLAWRGEAFDPSRRGRVVTVEGLAGGDT